MPRYLPSLSTKISLGHLPDSLGFLQNAADSIFDDIYFDHYQATSSKYGEEKTYNLDIVLNKQLGLEIPGAGVSLLLNPSNNSDPGQTSFNVSLFYRLGILRLLNNFSLANFSFKAEDLINILLKIDGIEPSTVLDTISTYIKAPNGVTLGYLTYTEQQLTDFFNDYYELTGTANELIYTDATTFNDIENGLASAGITTNNVIADFEISTDYPDGTDTIDIVYSKLEAEKDSGPLTIPDLISALNSDYSLTGTPNEITYIADPETTYEDIIAALRQADITLLTLIIDYIVLDNTSYSDIEAVVINFFAEVQANANSAKFYGLFDPFIQASINNLNLALAFPRSVLKPIDPATNQPYTDETIQSMLRFNVGAATFSTTDGFLFDNQNSFSFDKSQLGNTGLILSITDVVLDLSSTTNIPEATAAGYPTDFVGVYVKQAEIGLNAFGQDDTTQTSASLTATNMLIGTGGISGTIKLEDNGVLYRKFGNPTKPNNCFSVELDTFEITFKMGAIVNSSISGKLKLPGGFQSGSGPAEIDIDASIKDNGDFAITAKVASGTPPSITFPNVFTIAVRSLSVGEKNGRFFVSVAGSLDFITSIPGLGDVLPKNIIINKLLIWDDGTLEFDGGGLTVPKAFKLSIGPVDLEVSHLSIGSHTRPFGGVDRSYYYFGFDGTVNTGNAGLDATGNGIKFYFTNDDGPDMPFNCFLSIDSIAIDLTIPGDATYDEALFVLNGYLSMKNPDPAISGSTAGVEYTGKVSFDMPQVGIAGSAAMRLNPSIPAFVVDIGMQLPVALPLGPTGLGVYAFRGLIGQHYLASKSATTPPLPDTADWWDYYKAKSTLTKREGVEIDKFASKQGFSIGAGVSLASDFGDSGFTLSTKVFLYLGLPDLFLVQGQASILSQRLGLDEDKDPPFTALIVFSSQSIMGDLGVNLNLPVTDDGSKGLILSLQAKLEMAFFFNNASGWYLNIGRDTPASAQVQATILEIFKGHAYLMISSQGIKAGAGISYDFYKKFGPVQLWANAYLNMGGSISFKPIQIGGFIELGASAGIKVGWFSLNASLTVIFAVEAPNPFSITGTLRLKIHTPWPLPDGKIDASIGWTFNDNQAPLKVPIAILNIPDPANGYMPAAAHNILTNEIFPVNYVTTDVTASTPQSIPHPGDSSWKYNFNDADDVKNVIIPLDSFIDIDLLKPVLPGNVPLGGAANQLPDGYVDMVPPIKAKSNQVKHQYEITDIGIYAWSQTSNTWVPYNIYEAVTAMVDANPGMDFSKLKIGYWQFSTKDRYNKIRLLAQNMFSYTNGTTKNNLDMDARNYGSGDLFCYDNIQKTKLINWKALPAGISYPQDTPVPFKAVIFTFDGVDASVEPEAGFIGHSLLIAGAEGEVDILFPEPVAYAKLEFGNSFYGDDLGNAIVNFIKITYTPDDLGNAIPSDTIVSSFPINQQNAVIVYDDVANGIDKAIVVFANAPSVDYNGDLVLGGHFRLADQHITTGLDGDIEMDKALMYATFYDQSFTAGDVLDLEYESQASVVAQYPLNSTMASAGNLDALLSGSPDLIPGFYDADTTGVQQLNNIYTYSGNSDALIVPYDPALKIENGSFAFEATIVFDPFTAGLGTILSKVSTDAATGNKKGFALHLLQSTPADPQATYTSAGAIPTFTILFTCYDGLTDSGIQITESYTLDCASSKVTAQQYKRVLVSVNRQTSKLELYIDRELKASVSIPAELNIYESLSASTYLNQLSYITLADQTLLAASPITPEDVLNEVQVLSDSINNAIQPVWRPDTTFAVTVTTQDRVNGSIPSGSSKTRVFGFRTAGPLGHFHQFSPIYDALVKLDQADAFKLANLQFYIDYDRSFPDAQGRYNLSKPVLYKNPQVKLYFTEPYINAMYADWNTYQGLPAVQSSLQLQLLDPAGNAVTQSLVWAPVQDTPIDDSNFDTLTHDQLLIYLFNRAASQQGCGQLPAGLIKRLQQGSYQFPDLEPNTLYTALFKAIYTADGNAEDAVEVYKYSFLTSRFATFHDQASSYILGGTAADTQYAIYKQNVSFAASYIAADLTELINDEPSDDPAYAIGYAGKFERLVFGGLQLPAPEPFEHSAISLIVNTDPDDSTNRKLLGILVYNPEPFNDPKLPAASLVDTIKLTLTLPDATVVTPDQFIVSYSRDNSAAFITNTALNVPLGSIKLSFTYKEFNGIDYETVCTDCIDNAIDITPYF